MKKLILFSWFFLSIGLFAQEATIKGCVYHDNQPVPFARIKLSDDLKVIANEEGVYELSHVPYGAYTAQVFATGYAPFNQVITVESETQMFDPVIEEGDLELNAIVVTGNMRETMISSSPVKIEVLTRNFFKTNPVNSVIEALETVNGVQEQINCGVCGTNDIHINGMEGPYTLVLIDGMPIVSGLSSAYGFNGIPTSMINQVEIVKGPSSTLYGTEAVGGVINIITRPVKDLPLIEVDGMYNSHQELRSSVTFAPHISDRVFTSLSGDYYYNNLRLDENNDGFTDIPLNNRLSLFNKWHILDRSGDQMLSLAARYYTENRFGGTLVWTDEFRGSDSVYGENILTERIEVIGSYAFPWIQKKLRLDFSANYHEQDSYYGDVHYGAVQQVLFSNLIFNSKIGKRHDFISGFSNRYQTYQDNTPSETDERSYVPGLFVQDEFSITDEWILLAGARLDYHSRHGFIFSPRLNLKKSFGSFTSLRLNYGTGFRQVHLFTEDHAFISGARDVVIAEQLNPERSHNATFNLNHTYTKAGYGNLDFDVFYTYFSNKIIPDYDQDPKLIVYENLSGYGVSRGVSLAVNHKFTIPLRLRMGFTWMDVYEMTENELGERHKETQYFAPEFSGVFTLTYNFNKAGVSVSYTGKVIGPQRLPEFEDPFVRPAQAPWYTLQHVQLTKTFNKTPLEIYCGVKNIFNYTQPSPLIDPANPYGDYFDTSYAYGPLQVRRYFVGLRWSLNKKNG